jgi:hypothetical protein
MISALSVLRASLAGLAIWVPISLTACSSPNQDLADGDSVGTVQSEATSNPICPQGLRRLGAPLIATPSVDRKLAAWKEELATYQASMSPALAEAAAHAAEYAAVAGAYTGKSCVYDSDCETGHSSFRGSCNRYVWTGTTGACQVADIAPLPNVPPAPRGPAFNCVDYICPAGFQCEVEESKSAPGCTASCRDADNTGGGGGRRRGGR